jgi:hypothetical protein
MLLAHMTLIIGLALLLADRPMIFIPLTVLVALAPFPLYAARTEGGWKWRWGK